MFVGALCAFFLLRSNERGAELSAELRAEAMGGG